MEDRAGYQVTVPTGALGDLIDAVHELAFGESVPTWRIGNVTYLGRPRVRDLPVPGRMANRLGHPVAAIALTQWSCPTVDVVFVVGRNAAYAQFCCHIDPHAPGPDLDRLRGLVSTTAAVLTARGIPAHTDQIAER
ncbi:hypothetical protein [Nocardia caishijiensis]|uniref:Uncharacterized protein n=1 Tax=Nocardia caishijiensis TaxID=184756 RepID=A0ABQ6YHM6_9NOCA|nr:hypothetical protein [Nocardia caishijiensis]KAF0845274.1 hypothetical protein FNL39_10882 [Nocardia caishijiensis]